MSMYLPPVPVEDRPRTAHEWRVRAGLTSPDVIEAAVARRGRFTGAGEPRYIDFFI